MLRLYEIHGETKSCTRCGLFKAFSEFSANKALTSGLQSQCKPCKAELFRERKKNPHYRAAINAARRAKQPRYLALKRHNIVREMLYRAKARSKRRNVPFSITAADVLIPVCCPVFGVRFAVGADGRVGADRKLSKWSPSLDCVNPSLGYVPGNIQVISYLANSMKSNATRQQLERFARWILNERSEHIGRYFAAGLGAGTFQAFQ